MNLASPVYACCIVLCNIVLGSTAPNAFPGVFNPSPQEFPGDQFHQFSPPERVQQFSPPGELHQFSPPELVPKPQKAESDPKWGYGGYGGYGGYRPGPGGRPGGKMCIDRKGPYFCKWVLQDKKCDEGRNKKKCRKSCGLCGDEDCVDTSYNCAMASPFMCTQFWFSTGCKKTCKQCPGETTTLAPTTTPETEQACVDTSYNCYLANDYRCMSFWFRSGCRLTCKVCSPKTTLPPTTPEVTTATAAVTTTSEETTTGCDDSRDDCHTFLKLYCGIPSFLRECRRFCGKCGDEKENTTTAATTSQPTTFDITTPVQTDSPTTTKRIAKCFTTETTTTTTERPTTTEPVNTTTTSPPTTTTERRTTTEPVNTTTTALPTTTSIEVIPEETTGSGVEKLCVDIDEKNCHTWKSLGFCYNPKFTSDMLEFCPLSCDFCDLEKPIVDLE